MTDEMKLLRAFIEASGYEIESKSDTNRREVTQTERMRMPAEMQNKLVRGMDGKYWITTTNTDYKVTKKGG